MLLITLFSAGLVGCDSVTTRPPPPPTIPAGLAVAVSAGGSHSCSIGVDGRVICWGHSRDRRVLEEPAEADFQSVSVGEGYTCAIKKDGDIVCWVAGDNATNLRPGPFTAVSSGLSHTCALRENGTVECWLADASIYPIPSVGQDTPPPGSGPFRSVSAGHYHTCGVTTDDAALCWGDNEFGQSSPPEGSFRSVSAGSRHTCGIQTDESVVCWGSNEPAGYWLEREPGSATRPTRTPDPDPGKTDVEKTPIEVGQASPPSGSFQLVSAGFDHTCGIRTNGSLACWGSPRTGYEEPPISARQMTPPDGVFRSVSAGIVHACAVRQDGVIICWGYNVSHQTNPPGYLAMSSNGADYLCEQSSAGICWNKNAASHPDPPPDIPIPTRFTDMIAGELHTCALTDYAAIACWGRTYTPPEGAFQSISHGCAVTAEGAIACWRPDHLADGVAPPFGEFVSISGGRAYHGRYYYCAIAVDSSVECWGFDFGNSIRSPRGTFRQISVHGSNACGIRPDDSLYCWEYSFGGFGDPAPEGRFQSVSVGYTHACAVRDNGRVACWGHDADGRASPPRGKFKSVSVGGAHSCGIKVDDTLACWGANIAWVSSTGEFGLSMSSRSVFKTRYGQADPPEGKFQAIAAGEWHTCGIQTDGRATCWGANNDARAYTHWNDNYYYGQATPPAGNP